MTTDTRLVARVIEGDRDAFEAVYAACFGSIHAFAARHAAGRAEAESLAERILRRTFAELERYDGEVPFAAWLLTIARNEVGEARSERRTGEVHRAGRKSTALRYPIFPSRR